jgi:hypothetical protein
VPETGVLVFERLGVVDVGFDGVVHIKREYACAVLVVVPWVPRSSFPARGWGPVVVLEEQPLELELHGAHGEPRVAFG